MLQRVTHAGLRREMDHRPELAAIEYRFRALAVGEVDPMEGEIAKLPQNAEPCLFQSRIVIGIDAVNADDGAATSRIRRAAKADKSGRAGNRRGNPAIRYPYVVNFPPPGQKAFARLSSQIYSDPKRAKSTASFAGGMANVMRKIILFFRHVSLSA